MNAMALPVDGDWVTVKDKRVVPFREMARNPMLVPMPPDGERLRVRGAGVTTTF